MQGPPRWTRKEGKKEGKRAPHVISCMTKSSGLVLEPHTYTHPFSARTHTRHCDPPPLPFLPASLARNTGHIGLGSSVNQLVFLHEHTHTRTYSLFLGLVAYPFRTRNIPSLSLSRSLVGVRSFSLEIIEKGLSSLGLFTPTRLHRLDIPLAVEFTLEIVVHVR